MQNTKISSCTIRVKQTLKKTMEHIIVLFMCEQIFNVDLKGLQIWDNKGKKQILYSFHIKDVVFA